MEQIPDKTADGDVLGQAVSRRVARLATMPVDTSRMDEALRRRIDRRPRMWLWWATPLAGVAAALVVMVVLLSSATPRLSAADLAKVYSRLASAKEPLDVGSSGAMNMPMMCRLMSGGRGMCCREMVDHHNLTCMRIKTGSGKPVVMVMGNVHGEEMPVDGQRVKISGQSFLLLHSGAVNMVMRRVESKWFCAMGHQKPSALAVYLDRAGGASN